jgi:hypothetical protein
MPTNYTTLTRQELYDMVWATRMSSLEPSAVALSTCRSAMRLLGSQSHRPSATPDLTTEIGVWGAMEPKTRLRIAVSGVFERSELAPGDRFGYGERVPPQHVDVLVAER